MSNKKFAPGEWKIKKYLPGDYEKEQWHLLNTSDEIIAVIPTEAIAKFLAAAQEMFWVLRWMCFEKSISRCQYRPEGCEDCPIKAVLEQARGKPFEREL